MSPAPGVLKITNAPVINETALSGTRQGFVPRQHTAHKRVSDAIQYQFQSSPLLVLAYIYVHMDKSSDVWIRVIRMGPNLVPCSLIRGLSLAESRC